MKLMYEDILLLHTPDFCRLDWALEFCLAAVELFIILPIIHTSNGA